MIFRLQMCKRNGITNKFSLVGGTFMPQIHLEQPGFMYSARGPFTKNKKSLQKVFFRDGT